MEAYILLVTVAAVIIACWWLYLSYTVPKTWWITITAHNGDILDANQYTGLTRFQIKQKVAAYRAVFPRTKVVFFAA